MIRYDLSHRSVDTYDPLTSWVTYLNKCHINLQNIIVDGYYFHLVAVNRL